MQAVRDQCSGGRLVIVCGLPGSGKTTLAKTLAAERPAIRFGPDEWMHALGVNLWDADVRAQVEAVQWSVAKELVALGGSVIIEWGTWGRGEREHCAPRLLRWAPPQSWSTSMSTTMSSGDGSMAEGSRTLL